MSTPLTAAQLQEQINADLAWLKQAPQGHRETLAVIQRICDNVNTRDGLTAAAVTVTPVAGVYAVPKPAPPPVAPPAPGPAFRLSEKFTGHEEALAKGHATITKKLGPHVHPRWVAMIEGALGRAETHGDPELCRQELLRRNGGDEEKTGRQMLAADAAVGEAGLRGVLSSANMLNHPDVVVQLATDWERASEG